ncbi:MAG: hypothetical protein ACK55E_03590 [Cyanobacteriota bacterium]
MSPSNTRAGFVGGLLSTTDTGTWRSPLLTPLGTAAELLPSRPQAARWRRPWRTLTDPAAELDRPEGN